MNQCDLNRQLAFEDADLLTEVVNNNLYKKLLLTLIILIEK